MASKNMLENSLVIITALKTRHRSIGTTSTMPKNQFIHPKNRLEVELHNFTFFKQWDFRLSTSQPTYPQETTYHLNCWTYSFHLFRVKIISICMNHSCSDKDSCSTPLWLISSSILGFLLCIKVQTYNGFLVFNTSCMTQSSL